MTTTALAPRQAELMLAGPLGSLDQYIQAANAIPVLSAEEERELATRFRETNDLDAAKRLVLVASALRGPRGARLCGLRPAARRPDPGRQRRPHEGRASASTRTSACGSSRSRSIGSAPKSTNSCCATGGSSRSRRPKRSASCSSTCARPRSASAGSTRKRPQAVASRSRRDHPRRHRDGAAPQRPRRVVRSRSRGRRELRPGARICRAREQRPRALGRARRLRSRRHERLDGALAKLDERSRDILARRWLADDKATLHELAAEYGVSAERIRQIEANAIGKLRKQMGAPAPA